VNTKTTFTIKYVKNPADDRIKTFVEKSNEASVYHLPEWCNLIKRVFGHDSYYFYALSQTEEISGILPLVRIKSHLFGDYLVSMPYFNYGGAVACNQEVENTLMNEAIILANELGTEHIEFRDNKQRNGDWKIRRDKVNMLLDLPGNIDQLSKDLGSKIRAQIKRPLRENAEIINGGIELLDQFYDVFSSNMRDLGTPVYSKKFFLEILINFTEHTKIFLILIKGKVAAAGFLIGYHGKLEIPWASTKKMYNRYSVNMLLYWEALKFAIENDYKTFDFGRSSLDSGTYRFKKQWGAKPMQLYWHYWLKSKTEIPQINPSNPKYQMFINIWKHMPLFFTNLIGPMLIKNIP
jgi:serine/alanine adding enzyme